jgi:hypothetical protein
MHFAEGLTGQIKATNVSRRRLQVSTSFSLHAGTFYVRDANAMEVRPRDQFILFDLMSAKSKSSQIL